MPKLLTIAAITAGLLVAAPTANAAHKTDTKIKAKVALGAKKRKIKAKAALAPCSNTDVVPTSQNLDVVRAALLCLHNQVRAQAGLAALKENTKLRKAAIGQTNDMVANGYFDHTAPDGDTFVDRILAAGYTKRNAGWVLGENLAWGTGDLSTPQGIMNAWMNSSGHKANIVKKTYREVGFGIRLGVPSDDGVGVTITADFGARL